MSHMPEVNYNLLVARRPSRRLRRTRCLRQVILGEEVENFHSLRSPLNSDFSIKFRLDCFDFTVTVKNLRS